MNVNMTDIIDFLAAGSLFFIAVWCRFLCAPGRILERMCEKPLLRLPKNANRVVVIIFSSIYAIISISLYFFLTLNKIQIKFPSYPATYAVVLGSFVAYLCSVVAVERMHRSHTP